MEAKLDLYTDYLLRSFGQASATNVSAMLNRTVSHDVFTDMLATTAFDGRALWREVKPFVRHIQRGDGVIVVDDMIAHKPHREINGLVATHWEHSNHEYVRGINCLSLLYCAGEARIAVGEMFRAHLFATVCAFTKMEKLKVKEHKNHFALKG